MSTKQKDEIKLSEKYGLNPTMGICAWCGKPNGTIALLGELEGDVEAPKYMTLDYEPCKECEEKWAEGVVLMEVVEEPLEDGHMAVAPGVYPTGRLIVVAPGEHVGEAGDKFFIVPEDMERILSQVETDDTLQ